MKKKKIEEEVKEETSIEENENSDDIEEMVNEKKRNTKDLTKDIKKAKESLENTKIFEPTKEKENEEVPPKKVTKDISIIGELDLICIGYYIYLLLVDKYVKDNFNFIIPSVIIVFIVLMFSISVVANKKARKVINIINIISILAFIIYNLFYLI